MIPTVVLRLDPLGPSRKKHYVHGTGHKKGTMPPLDDEATRSASMFPDYVMPRLADAPKVTVGRNVKYLLVTSAILK